MSKIVFLFFNQSKTLIDTRVSWSCLETMNLKKELQDVLSKTNFHKNLEQCFSHEYFILHIQIKML